MSAVITDTVSAQAIAAAVHGLRDQAVQMLCDLVREPSLLGDEASAQRRMAATFAELGLSVEEFEVDEEAIRQHPGYSPSIVSYAGRRNVVGVHRPQAAVQGHSLILNGHIDVVPVGAQRLWTHPPFEPVVRGDHLYGRGAGDMKAGIVAYCMAFEALRKLGYEPAAPVFLQSVIEEECTGNGALACLQRGYRADAAIIPEPMGEHLLSAQVGVMWFQVKVRGRPAHVAVAGTGSNAIEACWPLVQALHRLEHRWNAQGHDAFAGHEHPVNFVLSRIEGGDWTSSVPAWCTFDMRIGLFPGMDLARARAEVEATVAQAAREDGFLSANPPELVYHGFQAEGWVMPQGSAAQLLLEECHEAVTDEPLPQVASTGTTDARFFGLYAGIPALVYGPLAEDIHAFDERVSLDSMRRVTQSIALFVAQWCGVEPR